MHGRNRIRAVALVLAAGEGRRFRLANGEDKLLTRLPGGRPLLAHTLAPITACGLPAMVVTQRERSDALTAWARMAADRAQIEFAEMGTSPGLAATLAFGVSILIERHAEANWLGVALGDMPYVQVRTWRTLLERLERTPHAVLAMRPVMDASAGHPVFFHRDLWPELQEQSGDRGGVAVWHAVPPRLREEVPVADPGIHHDVDQPDDLPTGY